MPMKNPPHPGRSVRHDCLEPLGLSVTDAARKLGVSRKQLSDVLNGHSGISPEMAIRLHKAFGGGADTWFRLQAAYDLAQAMKKESRSRSSGLRVRRDRRRILLDPDNGGVTMESLQRPTRIVGRELRMQLV